MLTELLILIDQCEASAFLATFFLACGVARTLMQCSFSQSQSWISDNFADVFCGLISVSEKQRLAMKCQEV